MDMSQLSIKEYCLTLTLNVNYPEKFAIMFWLELNVGFRTGGKLEKLLDLDPQPCPLAL